jgi:glutathione S-transferase
MILYDHPISSNALKVRFLLCELGVAFDRREVPLTQPRPASYLALNPLGGLPAIDDDGFVLAESNTILRYLAAREGRDDLYPSALRERAAVDEFLDRFSTTLRPALFRHEAAALGFVAGQGFRAAPDDPTRALAIAGEIAPQLTLLDRLVAANGTVLGSFTIADCAIAPALNRTFHSGLDLAGYPALARVRETVTARPAFLAAGPIL